MELVKNLRVMVDQSLSGHLWARQVYRNAFALLNRSHKCGSIYLPSRAGPALVNTTVLPIINYGRGTIPNLGLSALNRHRLQRAQNSALE